MPAYKDINPETLMGCKFSEELIHHLKQAETRIQEAAQEVPQGCDGDIAGLAGEIVQPGRVDDEAWDAGEGAEI